MPMEEMIANVDEEALDSLEIPVTPEVLKYTKDTIHETFRENKNINLRGVKYADIIDIFVDKYFSNKKDKPNIFQFKDLEILLETIIDAINQRIKEINAHEAWKREEYNREMYYHMMHSPQMTGCNIQ